MSLKVFRRKWHPGRPIFRKVLAWICLHAFTNKKSVRFIPSSSSQSLYFLLFYSFNLVFVPSEYIFLPSSKNGVSPIDLLGVEGGGQNILLLGREIRKETPLPLYIMQSERERQTYKANVQCCHLSEKFVRFHEFSKNPRIFREPKQKKGKER